MSNDIEHDMFQTEGGSYLNFGDKRGPPTVRTVSAGPATASSVPRLPSISQARPSAGGLRKLQQQPESVQEDSEEQDVTS